jgi:hypothetical protein
VLIDQHSDSGIDDLIAKYKEEGASGVPVTPPGEDLGELIDDVAVPDAASSEPEDTSGVDATASDDPASDVESPEADVDVKSTEVEPELPDVEPDKVVQKSEITEEFSNDSYESAVQEIKSSLWENKYKAIADRIVDARRGIEAQLNQLRESTFEDVEDYNGKVVRRERPLTMSEIDKRDALIKQMEQVDYYDKQYEEQFNREFSGRQKQAYESHLKGWTDYTAKLDPRLAAYKETVLDMAMTGQLPVRPGGTVDREELFILAKFRHEQKHGTPKEANAPAAAKAVTADAVKTAEQIQKQKISRERGLANISAGKGSGGGLVDVKKTPSHLEGASDELIKGLKEFEEHWAGNR